jgi:pSer/pThr/pTyr-binding forkhead associated (FHA) protein
LIQAETHAGPDGAPKGPDLDLTETTSDSIIPAAETQEKATLRILLPTGDVFDREITRLETQMGKNPRNDIMIADSAVSSTHALIRNENGIYTISDLGSRNGTYVNGERISKPRRLEHGDVIGLGLSKLTFRMGGHSETGAINATEVLTAPVDTGPPPLTEESLARAVVAGGLVTAGSLGRLRADAPPGRRLYRVLAEQRAVSEEALRDLMSRTFQIDVVDLRAAEVDETLTARFPALLAREHKVFPIASEPERLILAVADPTDSEAVRAVEREMGTRVVVRLATLAEIAFQIERHYAPRLVGVLPSGDKLEYPIVQREVGIGKATHNHIVLTDPTVSNTHAVILVRDGGYSIVDLGSRNGTFVNGEKLGDHARTLRHGDAIQLGKTVLTFRNPSETAENVTATLSADALAEVRRRADAEPQQPEPAIAGVAQVQEVQASPLVEVAAHAQPGSEQPSAEEHKAEKKKKKKKKKVEEERIKAAWVRALGQVVGPLVGAIATGGLVFYLAQRPVSSPDKPPVDPGVKGKARASLGALAAGTQFKGGPFEASGVAYVNGTDQVLFIDDNRPGQVLLMRLNSTGTQDGPVRPVDLGVEVLDPEGITFDGVYFYVVGSQADPKGGAKNSLVRFLLDSNSGSLRREVEVVGDLRSFLISKLPELSAVGERKGEDGGLNIEGIAWDPNHARFLLGLRSPVVGGSALVVPLKLRDPVGPFSTNNLDLAEAGAIRLALGGLGIRDIQYDLRLRAFLIIAGAPEHGEKTDFVVYEWNGDADQSKPESRPAEKTTISKAMKPEGITGVRIAGQEFILIVGDASVYTRLDYSNGQ